MKTWVPGAAGSAYDVDNLPYGVFVAAGEQPRVGVRIGDLVLDLAPVAAAAMLEEAHVFEQSTLNPLMGLGKARNDAIRRWIVGLLVEHAGRADVEPHLVPLGDVEMRMPFDVGDYVDFYASEHHASAVGKIFRPEQEPLLPNWKHLPVGYHGRAGTVVPSGTDIVRPMGQRVLPGSTTGSAPAPVFGPSGRLDIEAELGFVVGTGTTLGARVSTAAFADHAFGLVGVNDWSARDIQAWEYVPLGPFLGKSFATSISTWVTPLAALDAAWVDLPGQDPEPLPYLQVDGRAGLDISIEVSVNGHVVSRPPYRSMYWSPAQMLAHLTVNGASVRTGDLWASGTVSGPVPEERGSFLELSWGWREPFAVGDQERLALEDGDEVTLTYTAPGTLGGRIALGEVTGRIVPARP
ncbi:MULTISPECIES: fumarylacetoacetase [unclassified Nocardioides]|uniref:fumarylacetoacetase n=1 Tax=unclassified Nocardioides TaxID=2615069 RepID=UPI0006FC560C|nr:MULTISPECIES: fumarylacetoacetase [unclassified Nocardioides]KQY56880.1 fumarylacetoacetase [Nocardioides sp. Root140]KQZ66924.1 fumarylacetoacetase [Nocardioides sp. Root151]KRF13002.1 fumarylacetoacetase [Nocardioides sp. Soil796]